MELEIASTTADGYTPLVHSDGWRVAVVNSCDRLLEDRLVRAERHLCTDEVFVLLYGAATLHIGTERRRYRLEQGKTYNVKRNVWHNISLETDSSVLIIENDDTSPANTEYYYFNEIN